MLRTRPAASFARASLHHVTYIPMRNAASSARTASHHAPFCHKLAIRRPLNVALAFRKPLSTSLQKYSSPYDKIDKKHEEEVEHHHLHAHPEQVSSSSTMQKLFYEEDEQPQEQEQQQEEAEEQDIDMLAGAKREVRDILKTFSLTEVPREALVIGLAGVIPYLATSISTLYLAFDINHVASSGYPFFFPLETARAMLDFIVPLQIGYGAVILSFLGAIHWGLEWAKFGGEHGYRRYAYGVIAPAVAWPTIFMPVEMALISQFCAFTFFYFADAQSVTKGWSPSWYGTYRWVLTFFVGASIVVSLVGRGQVWDQMNRLPSPADRYQRIKDMQYELFEEEARYKMQQRIAADMNEAEEEQDVEEDEDNAE